MLGLIWIQIVRHSDGILERLKKNKSADIIFFMKSSLKALCQIVWIQLGLDVVNCVFSVKRLCMEFHPMLPKEDPLFIPQLGEDTLITL